MGHMMQAHRRPYPNTVFSSCLRENCYIFFALFVIVIEIEIEIVIVIACSIMTWQPKGWAGSRTQGRTRYKTPAQGKRRENNSSGMTRAAEKHRDDTMHGRAHAPPSETCSRHPAGQIARRSSKAS
jgi:hypothetical protein